MGVYAMSEVRMHRDAEGRVRAAHPAAAYAFWHPFVQAFGSIEVVGRMAPETGSDSGLYVDGPGVSVHDAPYYAGALSLPLGLLRIRSFFSGIGGPRDIFVLRVPEFVSLVGYARARRVRAATIAFLVADPRQHAKAILPKPFGLILSVVLHHLSRAIMRHADCSVYVSQSYLQASYPPGPAARVLARSNVVIDDEWLRGTRAGRDRSDRVLDVISVGTFETRAKGFDLLIDAAAHLQSAGRQVRLTFVGDGRYRHFLQRRASRRGVQLVLTGSVDNREELRRLLDAADIYASGSRAEGLPRATIEAMARGLPVVTTNAGAARELVRESCVTPLGDYKALAAAIAALADDDEMCSAVGEENRKRARELAELASPERLVVFLREAAAVLTDSTGGGHVDD